MTMRQRLGYWFAGGWALIALMTSASALAGEVLNAIQARGTLRCGVSEDAPGFAERDAAGRWQGFEIDLCRALAAAVLGDGGRIEPVPVRASTRFPALQSGRIDLLFGQTTWTLTREAILKVQFPAIILYDSQGILVPAQSSARSLSDLAGASICLTRGTNHLRYLEEAFTRRGLTIHPLILDSSEAVQAALSEGRCLAYTNDTMRLAAIRLRLPGGRDAWRILDERISREPVAAAVWGGDPDWATAVRWVIQALLLAEELGITRADLAQLGPDAPSPFLQLAPDESAQLARQMGLSAGWARRAVEAVGNYAELFDRHLGPATPLGLERGPNRLWNQGGLFYPLPLD